MYAAGIDIGTTTISILLLDPDKKTLIGRRTMEHNSFCEGDAGTEADQGNGTAVYSDKEQAGYAL